MIFATENNGPDIVFPGNLANIGKNNKKKPVIIGFKTSDALKVGHN